MFNQEDLEDYAIDVLEAAQCGFRKIAPMDGVTLDAETLAAQAGAMPAALIAAGAELYEDRSGSGTVQQLTAELLVYVAAADTSRERARKSALRALCRKAVAALRGAEYRTATTAGRLRLVRQELALAERGIVVYEQVYRLALLDTNERTD